MASSDLETRVRRLEDLAAIAELKHTYAALCDDDYDADGLAELFTQDAVWDGGVLGHAEGREAIREMFSRAGERMPFAIHHVTNSRIELDGDRATGHWYLWQPCVASGGEVAADDLALWMAGRYDDEYVRDGGKWRFQRTRIQLRLLSPYDAGWASSRIAEVGDR